MDEDQSSSDSQFEGEEEEEATTSVGMKHKLPIWEYRKFHCTYPECTFSSGQHLEFNIHIETQHECPYCGRYFADVSLHTCPNHGRYHRQYGMGRVDQSTFKLFKDHHRRAVTIYQHLPTEKYVSLTDMFEKLHGKLTSLLHDLLDVHIIFKAQFKVLVDLENIKTGELLEDIWLATSMVPLTHPNFVKGYISFMLSYLTSSLAIYNQNGSGFTLREIKNFHVIVAEHDAKLGGGSHVPLPKELKRKKGLLNLIDTKKFCFHYCIAAAFFKEEVQRQYMEKFKLTHKKYPSANTVKLELSKGTSYMSFLHKFNFKALRVPTPVEDLHIFTANNDISLNLFGYREKKVFPIITTTIEKSRHVNLLFVEGEVIGHYLVIEDLSQFLGIRHKTKLCKYCFKRFNYEKTLQKHHSTCVAKTGNKLRFPVEDFYEFKNMHETIKFPFAIYYDYETFSEPMNKQVGKSTTNVGKIVPAQYSLVFVGPNGYLSAKIYDGPDPVADFLNTVNEMADRTRLWIKDRNQRIVMTDEEKKEYYAATKCVLCNGNFTKKNYRVKHHCHVTGKNLGATCNVCNIRAKTNYILPVIAHGGTNFDHHLLIQGMKSKSVSSIQIIPKSAQKFMGFLMNKKLKFVDSCQFMPGSLSDHAKSLLQDGEQGFEIFFQYFSKIKHNEDFYKKGGYQRNEIRLLLKKQAFPYELMTDKSVFELTNLPSIETFKNKLTLEDVDGETYKHAQKVWQTFQCKTFKDYTRLYCIVDTLILACIMEAQRKASYEAYGLEMLHKWSSPGFSHSAGMFTSKARIQYIKDPEMVEMIRSGIRGGPCFCNTRLYKANNERIGNFDPSQPRKHCIYADINSLYPTQLLEAVPTHDFEWLKGEELEKFDVTAVPEDSGVGYIIECDLEYPAELHDAHQDLPLAPEKKFITLNDLSDIQYKMLQKQFNTAYVKDVNVEKLVLTVEDKDSYVSYYKTLKFYLTQGLKIKGKVKRVIRFKESPVFKGYIGASLERRAHAVSLVMKYAEKLAANSFYGKFLQSSAKYKDIKLCTTRAQALELIARPEFHDFYGIDQDLSIFIMNKKNPREDSLFFIAFTILELAKLHLMKTHYEGVKSVFGERCQILYSDTDSAIYGIDDPNNTYMADLKSLSWLFDYSTLKGHELFDTQNASKPGKFKIEAMDIEEFCGLSAKLYSYKRAPVLKDGVLVDGGEKKAKGVSKAVVKHKIAHDDYVKTVQELKIKYADLNLIRSKNQQLYNQTLRKIALNALDMKRYILPDGVHTLPFGHVRIKEFDKDNINSMMCIE